MKLNVNIAGFLMVIGIFIFAPEALAQKNKKAKENPSASAPSQAAETNQTNNAAPSQSNKNINIVGKGKGKNRPPSTGSGNARPNSTGETISESERLDRANELLFDLKTMPAKVYQDYGTRLERVYSFINSGSSAAWTLRENYRNDGNPGNNTSYTKPEKVDLKDVKYGLEQSLKYLNEIEYESNGKRVAAISSVNEALRLIQPFIDNPPPPPTRTPRESPTGSQTANPNNGAGNDRMATSTSAEVPRSGKKPKAGNKNRNAAKNSATNSPSDNLFPLDDPFGKKPKKSKKNSGN